MSSKSNRRKEKVAVIDVGSNTIKLIIASSGKNAPIEIEDFVVEETRIGEGMTGNPPIIDKDAIKRGSKAILRLSKIAEKATNTICIVATSAVRDASNKQVFVNEVEKKCGHELRILSGDEEAELIGRGLQCDPELTQLDSFSIMDLGGGSLECIQFSNHKAVNSQSLQLGAVRLASLFVKNRKNPLSKKAEAAIADHVNATWQASLFERNSSPSPIAVITGGTSSILSDILGNKRCRKGIPLDEFVSIKDGISNATFDERVSDHQIPESRADIFPTALLTLELSLKFLGCEIIRFSKYNLRYGVAAMLLKHGSLR